MFFRKNNKKSEEDKKKEDLKKVQEIFGIQYLSYEDFEKAMIEKKTLRLD